MNDLSRETVELLVPDAAARGARVQTNLHGTPVVVWGNRAQLQQVVLNLVSERFVYRSSHRRRA